MKKKNPDPPDLPTLQSLESFAANRIPAGSDYSEILFEGIDWHERTFVKTLFDSSVFTRANLAGTKFRDVKIQDTRIVDSDLSNADWTAVSLNRVEISSTRLTGFNGAEGDYRDVLFKSCGGKYTVFPYTRFDWCRFEKCQLSEATFEGSVLKNLAFLDCDLTGARFWADELDSIDLRGSNIEGIQIRVEHLKSIIIDPSQASVIALLAGAAIRNEDLL